jgi:hypothetical protein
MSTIHQLNFNDPTGHDAYSTCGGNIACIRTSFLEDAYTHIQEAIDIFRVSVEKK